MGSPEAQPEITSRMYTGRPKCYCRKRERWTNPELVPANVVEHAIPLVRCQSHMYPQALDCLPRPHGSEGA